MLKTKYRGSDWIAPPTLAHIQFTASAKPSASATGRGSTRRNHRQPSHTAAAVQATENRCAATTERPVMVQSPASASGYPGG